LKVIDAYERGFLPSFRAVARHFEAPYGGVEYRSRGGNSQSTRLATNRLLSRDKEGGLVLWMKERVRTKDG
jgi:hypothetical protein